MIQLALGFPGERFIYLPLSLIDVMIDSPLTGDLILYSLGHFSHARYHYINRINGCKQYIFIYCKEGKGFHIVTVLPKNLPGVFTGCISLVQKQNCSPRNFMFLQKSIIPNLVKKSGSNSLKRCILHSAMALLLTI